MKFHLMVQCLLLKGDDSKTPLLKHLESSITVFMNMRIIWPISPSHQSHQNSVLSRQFWSKLEIKQCDRYLSSSSVPEFFSILQTKWYKFPLETIQDMYLSILQRLQSVKKVNDFSTFNKHDNIGGNSMFLSNPSRFRTTWLSRLPFLPNYMNRQTNCQVIQVDIIFILDNGKTNKLVKHK